MPGTAQLAEELKKQEISIVRNEYQLPSDDKMISSEDKYIVCTRILLSRTHHRNLYLIRSRPRSKIQVTYNTLYEQKEGV